MIIELEDSEKAIHLQHEQITKQLTGLDAKEENLLDLAADGTLPKAKIQQRLRDIEHERTKLRPQLQETTDTLRIGAEHLEECLQFLADLPTLYDQTEDSLRRRIIQAVYRNLRIYSDEVTGETYRAPLAELHDAEAA